MEKRCCRCKTHKSKSEFCSNKSKRDGFSSICRDCSKAKSKAYYAINKEKQKKQINNRKRKRIYENKRKIFEYLTNNPCPCGESDPRVLEFDHLRDKTKDVSLFLAGGYSWERILKEISKCQVLCANCHRRKTAKDYAWYTHKFLLEKTNEK